MLSIFMQHKIFAAGAVGVGALALWFFLSADATTRPSDTSLLTAESAPGILDPASQELIETLAALRAIHLDGIIFGDPAFTALQDFSTEITHEPAGRPNPFAPLSQSVLGGGTSKAGIFSGPASSKR